MLRAAITALAVSFAMPVIAQENCATNEQVHDILNGKYGEEVIARGYDGRGQLVSWWGNTETGSWTATVTVQGITCIVAQGERFRRISLKPNV